MTEITEKNAIFSIEMEGKSYLLGVGHQFVEMAKEKGFPIPQHLEPDKFYRCDENDVFTEVYNVKINGGVNE